MIWLSKIKWKKKRNIKTSNQFTWKKVIFVTAEKLIQVHPHLYITHFYIYVVSNTNEWMKFNWKQKFYDYDYRFHSFNQTKRLDQIMLFSFHLHLLLYFISLSAFQFMNKLSGNQFGCWMKCSVDVINDVISIFFLFKKKIKDSYYIRPDDIMYLSFII